MKTLAKEERLRWWAYGPHQFLEILRRTFIVDLQDVDSQPEIIDAVQEVIGVGYKVQANGNVMEMDLGYSHKIFFELAPEIKVETVTEKGKNPIITMTCCDKQILGQAAAKIRSLRKPEPYKGKGIRFQGEEIRKKAGKAAAK